MQEVVDNYSVVPYQNIGAANARHGRCARESMKSPI